MSASHGTWCGARTFPANCRDCRKPIFIFFCNHDCRVLFDDRGVPWPKHNCIEYWMRVTGKSRVQLQQLIREKAEALQVDVPSLDPLYLQTVEPRRSEVPPPIVRVEPDRQREKLRILGVLRELPQLVDPARKLNLFRTGLFARELKRHFPGKSWQITVHANPIGAQQIESYTILMPDGALSKLLAGLPQGVLLALEVTAVFLPGDRSVWRADALDVVAHS